MEKKSEEQKLLFDRSQRPCRSPSRVGTRQRCQGQERGPLGELGRLFADGPPTPSHLGRDYD